MSDTKILIADEKQLEDMAKLINEDLRRELNQAIKERDEARECLRQAMSPRGSVSVKTRMRWLKAAGLNNSGNNENAPIVNREEEQ
jgi:hypothetical protein